MMRGYRTDKTGKWSPAYDIEQKDPPRIVGWLIFAFLVTALTLIFGY